MLRLVCLLTFLLLVPIGPLAYAQEGAFECQSKVSDSQILRKVQQAYDKVSSLKASFSQASYLKALDFYEHSRGEMWFERPGKMRWNYVHPEQQEFLIRDSDFWFYQAADQQVTVDSFNKVVISELPIAFLMGMGNLQEDFKVDSLCRNPNGLLMTMLPMREEEQAEGGLAQLKLLVNADTYRPVGAEVLHQGGNRTGILLSQLEFNSSLKDAIFEADFPKGIDVIDRRVAQ
ncbi:MAG: outer membrane lipoprotein carrier protein LolA [Bdellovibrionales bacterium]|nr:outer membrane lipoprotein carrier protein LolA [Bdellovibrionales bacterium]